MRATAPEQRGSDAVRAAYARGLATGLRLVTAPSWPMMSALLLALAAMIELRLAGAADVAQGVMLALLSTLPLAMRRTQLWVAAILVTFATTLLLAGQAPWTASGLIGQLWVLYLVGARHRRRWWWLLVGVLLVGALSAGGAHDAPPGELVIVLAIAVLVLGDALAERDATRRAMVDTLQDQAVMEERARIAREMHDVVAHHISTISVQAETARLTTAELPEEGRQQLESIGGTARDALTEMRRLLGVLRSDDDAERAPQPGLAQLAELIHTARTAGTRVRLILEGPPAPLPPGVDLTAYRILQEALTNARRHAPGAAVDVELHYAGDRLRLAVRDDGPGSNSVSEGGHGLLGMRERAAIVGGSLHAGPADGGGFAVEAELPT